MRLGIIALSVIGVSSLLAPAQAAEPGAPDKLITRLDAAAFEVQRRLGKPFRPTSPRHKREHGGLVAYYADHGSDLLWVDESGLTDKARAVMAEITRADDYGLRAADYRLPSADDETDADARPALRLANLELKMSWAVMNYARDARGGRLAPETLGDFLDPTLRLPVPRDLLEQLASSDAAAADLRRYHPQTAQFEALRQKLLSLRTQKPRKHIVVPRGPILKKGARHAQIAVLRKRLEAPASVTEDNPDADPKLYDTALFERVKAFQKSRGLNAEGIVGPATRRALNVRPKNRVRTILANMERWRWLPDDLSGLHIRVNIPEFLFRVLDKGEALHTERVVVGKLKHKTPVFSDEMEHIVFNPFWNVPNSIKVKEILPGLTRASGWFSNNASRVLARQGLQVKYRGRAIDPSRVDWSRVDIRRYHIYQPPGGRNVLGVVKFMFPNKHSVYMHDTTSKSLFKRQVRAYSHGCVRVRNPRKLAELLLGRDAGWTRSRISNTIASGQNTHVKLKSKIPVHVTYFTARVEADGKMRYFRDIYGHDSRIAAALRLPRGS